MKKLLFLGLFMFTSLFLNAQFSSRKHIIQYLCSRPFYDIEKEYKIEFKVKEVEFAGSISKQLQIFSNGNLLGIVSQDQLKLNPHGQINGYVHEVRPKVWFDVYCNDGSVVPSYRGKIIIQDLFGLPIDFLNPGSVYK